MKKAVEIASMFDPSIEIIALWPSKNELEENGIGYYIKNPSDSEIVQYL